MVALKSFMARDASTDNALSQIRSTLDASAANTRLVCAFYDSAHRDTPIYDFVREHFPHAALVGGTSCHGVMNENGLGGSGSIGLLAIDDPTGDYGSAAIELDDDPSGCAERALRAALEDADCSDELPELIWIYQTPGREEAVIAGLRRVVGDRCPIVGGSSADNNTTGEWRQLGPDGPLHDGLAVAVFFSSGGIGVAFQGGYEPSGASGIATRVMYDPAGDNGVVTKARGRQVLEIDGEPAADVYNRWTGGLLDQKLEHEGSILADTTMYPLGIDIGKIGDVAHYLLVHPDRLVANHGLSTFATIDEGTRLHGMRGDKDRLVERAGRVAHAATAMLPGGAYNLAGGLIVYCAGCMIAVGERMPGVALSVRDSLGDRPFLGCFTFGEQGSVLETNAHGNLMISAIAFGR